MSCLSYGRRAVLPALLALLTGAAHANRNETQYWISQGASFRLGGATSVGIDTSERLSDQSAAKTQYLARLVLSHRLAKNVEVAGGFAWSQVNHVDEYRPFAEATLSHGLLALRSRLEARMFDNADRTVWRLREKLTVAVPLDKASRWAVQLNGEAMFNLNSANVSRQTGLAQVRALAGVRRALGERLTLTLAYQRQQAIVSGGEDVVTHQPILALAARF